MRLAIGITLILLVLAGVAITCNQRSGDERESVEINQSLIDAQSDRCQLARDWHANIQDWIYAHNDFRFALRGADLESIRTKQRVLDGAFVAVRTDYDAVNEWLSALSESESQKILDQGDPDDSPREELLRTIRPDGHLETSMFAFSRSVAVAYMAGLDRSTKGSELDEQDARVTMQDARNFLDEFALAMNKVLMNYCGIPPLQGFTPYLTQ